MRCFIIIFRPNPRCYTAVANSGVSRSERLVGWVPPDPYMPVNPDPYTVTPGELVTDEVAGEVHRMAQEHGQSHSGEQLTGLEECYRRICKVNSIED